MSPELVLVRAAVKRHGSSEVARRLGVASEGTVRAWIAGKSAPRPKVAARIRAEFGSNGVDKAPPSASSASAAPAQPAAPPIDTTDPEKTAIAVLEKLIAELQNVKSERLPSLANSITKAAKLVAELRGLVDVTETQILRSPAWVKLRNAVWGALEPYPEAMKAVNDAIAQLDVA